MGWSKSREGNVGLVLGQSKSREGNVGLVLGQSKRDWRADGES